MGSLVKQTLKTLCCSNGWSYAVLWGSDQRSPMLLTVEDAYCEENMSTLVDDMRLKFHIFGEGIIGQAAFTRRNRWIFSDSHCQDENQTVFQDKSEFQDQFISSGIKTVAVVSVESRGVLQFGSTEKILEHLEFFDQIKKLFCDIGNIDGLILAGVVPPSKDEGYDANWVPFPLSSERSFRGNLTSDTICTGSWSGEASMLTSFETLISSKEDIWESSFSSPIENTPGLWESTGGPINIQETCGNSFRKSTDNSDASILITDGLLNSVTSLPRISEEFMPAECSSDVSNFLAADGGLSEWFASSSRPDADLKFDFGSGKNTECLEDVVKPMINGGFSDVSVGMPRCASLSNIGCTSGSQTGLFSALGLEELLKGVSRSDSMVDHFPATKRRKTESSSSNFNLDGLSVSSGSINLMRHSHTLERTNCTTSTNDPKSQVGLWINDSYSNNVVHNAVGASKKVEEPPKAIKKRAKPGQSKRPRPKDRQMIQDRLKELRGIIPDSGKCSIDSLLERTVKYMFFLQGVTKYADKLTQADEAKLIGPDRGAQRGGSFGGATWAYEVGDHTMCCPVIVEDLYPPGQMLIEMLCEDRGFFIEIADIVKGFGLNILKGVMEMRDEKIWARFIVEANKQVTRLDILWSLIQLLQQTAIKEFNVHDEADSSKGRIFPRKYG